MDYLVLSAEQKEHNQIMKKYFENVFHFKFFGPCYKEVPNVSGLMPDTEQNKDVIEVVEYYLLASYIVNMNTNVHLEMRSIIKGFGTHEALWFKEHSKLRINRWSQICSTVSYFFCVDMGLSIDDRVTNYSRLSFDEKTLLVSQYDRKLYKVLEQLYERYSAMQPHSQNGQILNIHPSSDNR